MVFTQVIFDHPGYFWVREPGHSHWTLGWEPVQGYYSPPKFERNIMVQEVEIPLDIVDEVGYVIGKLGKHFKFITQSSKTKYIFYRSETNKIEIWGVNQNSIDFAGQLLMRHFEHLRRRRSV